MSWLSEESEYVDTEFEHARPWKRVVCWLIGHRWWGGLGMFACVRCDKNWKS